MASAKQVVAAHELAVRMSAAATRLNELATQLASVTDGSVDVGKLLATGYASLPPEKAYSPEQASFAQSLGCKMPSGTSRWIASIILSVASEVKKAQSDESLGKAVRAMALSERGLFKQPKQPV